MFAYWGLVAISELVPAKYCRLNAIKMCISVLFALLPRFIVEFLNNDFLTP